MGAMETLHSTWMDKLSDSELVAASKFGNSEAFDELVIRHKRRVIALAERILNNREDAEDVAQESFHKAYLHIGSFQEKSLFSTWLTRIVMNEAFMVLRRRRRSFEVSQEGADDGAKPLEATFVDQSPNPEQSCWRLERSKTLTEAINRLSPKLRRTILLYDIEEYSLDETARILGTSIAAVKSRLYHGHDKLRGRMNPGDQLGMSAPGSREARC
jgi:RNA polymerase sigma-70 factor (ECF subfamily)